MVMTHRIFVVASGLQARQHKPGAYGINRFSGMSYAPGIERHHYFLS
jgi:hypothetical protein